MEREHPLLLTSCLEFPKYLSFHVLAELHTPNVISRILSLSKEPVCYPFSLCTKKKVCSNLSSPSFNRELDSSRLIVLSNKQTLVKLSYFLYLQCLGQFALEICVKCALWLVELTG